MFGNRVVPRWRLPMVYMALCALLTGCAARVQEEMGGDDGEGLAIPCVKVPLVRVPLTNRRCSNNLFEDLLPESDPANSSIRW